MTTLAIIVVNVALATTVLIAIVGLLFYAIKTAYHDEVSCLTPAEFRDIVAEFYKPTSKRLRHRGAGAAKAVWSEVPDRFRST